MKRKPTIAAVQPQVVPQQHRGLFRNAITEADGVSVNIGYLSLFWLLSVDVALSFIAVGAGFIQQYFDVDHVYPLVDVAAALGAIWATFSTALGALGLFLMGDRRPMPPSTSVSLTQTTVP